MQAIKLHTIHIKETMNVEILDEKCRQMSLYIYYITETICFISVCPVESQTYFYKLKIISLCC